MPVGIGLTSAQYSQNGQNEQLLSLDYGKFLPTQLVGSNCHVTYENDFYRLVFISFYLNLEIQPQLKIVVVIIKGQKLSIPSLRIHLIHCIYPLKPITFLFFF